MSHLIRTLRILDLPALSRLAHRASQEDYRRYPAAIQRTIARRNGWRPLLTGLLKGHRRTLVAVQYGQPVGYLIGTVELDGVSVIHWLYVAPAARGNGLARELLDHFEAALPDSVHRLMVWTEVAADYYRRLGWHETAELTDHWWHETFWLFTKSRGIISGRTGGGRR